MRGTLRIDNDIDTLRLTHAGEGLAKAHGVAADAFHRAVEEVKALGIHGEDALTMVNKLIVADVGVEKAKGIAQLAKDLSAIGNTSVPEAMESIVRAIETGMSRTLKASGLVVDFTKQQQIAELQLGRTLSENELIQMRYAAVMKAGQAIQGAFAASAGDAEMQSKRLGVEVEELKEAVGAGLQGEFKSLIGHLRDLVAWLKDNVDLIEKFGKMAIWLAGLLITYGVATKIWEIAAAVKGLSAALAANPWALMLTGIVAGGAIIYKSYKDMQEGMENRRQEMENTALRNDLLSGKTKIADLRKRGMSDDQIRELISGRKAIPGEESPWGEFGAGLPKVKIAGEPDVDALKAAAEVRKRQRENEKYFREQAIAAGGAGKTGFAKDVADLNAEIARRTTYTDDKGTHTTALTKGAWDAIIDQMQKKLQAFKEHFALENKKALADYLKDEEEAAHKQLEWEAQRYQQRIQNDTDIAEKNLEHLRDVSAFEEQRAGFERDARLRQLEGRLQSESTPSGPGAQSSGFERHARAFTTAGVRRGRWHARVPKEPESAHRQKAATPFNGSCDSKRVGGRIVVLIPSVRLAICKIEGSEIVGLRGHADVRCAVRAGRCFPRRPGFTPCLPQSNTFGSGILDSVRSGP